MNLETYTFPSGLKIIHLPVNSYVSYCGFAINAGARDEDSRSYGMAHFIEHMLFKGTTRRKAGHIINRMENVGGELNAYTTKEETFIYSVFLEEYYERAFELLYDMVFHSVFPRNELIKEREVIMDEINSYRDDPAELILDEFENLLFKGHEIGHNILGTEETLQTFDQGMCFDFHNRYYHPSNLVFFSMGRIPLKKILGIINKYSDVSEIHPQKKHARMPPPNIAGKHTVEEKNLFQAHVMIGCRAYEMNNNKCSGLFLLNNILGGPGMNSRLNLSLREKSALVYNIESNFTSYTDTGVFNIYFGCDKKHVERCINKIYTAFRLLKENKLSGNQLAHAKKQLKGQIGIGRDNKENVFLGIGKNFLHNRPFDSLEEVSRKIDRITSEDLMETAHEIFDEKKIFHLVYT